MKAIIQRVSKASVSGNHAPRQVSRFLRTVILTRKNAVPVDGEIISSIGNGLCVLVGIQRTDTLADMKYIVRKILNIKVFDDASGKRWAASVVDKQYEILCISQFTLYHSLKGNKLDFHRAMPAQESEPFYMNFLSELGKGYKPELIKDGKFGAMMEVSIENSGPVTLEIESASKSMSNESTGIQEES